MIINIDVVKIVREEIRARIDQMLAEQKKTLETLVAPKPQTPKPQVVVRSVSGPISSRGAVTRRLSAMKVGDITVIPKSYSKKKILSSRSYIQYKLREGKFKVRGRTVTRVA